jgi:uncharacterized MAPEG superfamily protein
MPPEHEFMKSAKDKQMPEEEYKKLREEYDKKANEAADRVKKTLIAFFAAFAVSFAALNLFALFNGEADSGAGVGNYTWLAVQLLLAVFLYGLKPEDDKSNQYETDRTILLNYVRRKITAFKIRLGLVIGLGTVFVIINIICWIVAVMLATDNASQRY